MAWRLSKTSKHRLVGVDSRLIELCDRALELSPIDFGIPEDGGVRTASRQHELFSAGKSKCDGFLKPSRHQSGKALDFFAYVDGAASWDKLHLALIGAAFLQAASELGYRIIWGGLWCDFPDYPHVQIV